MNKQEFLKSLKEELAHNKVVGIQDILADYEEHFTHGLSKNKSETEITAGLGQPAIIAKAYQTETMIKEVKGSGSQFQWGKALHVIARLIVIAPFNMIVLFVPGILIFVFFTVGWCLSLASASASFAVLGALGSFGALTNSLWAWIAALSASAGLLGLAAFGGVIMFYMSKYILLGLISYLQWNLKFVIEK